MIFRFNMNKDKQIIIPTLAFVFGWLIVSFGAELRSPGCGLIVFGLILMFVSAVAVRNS